MVLPAEFTRALDRYALVCEDDGHLQAQHRAGDRGVPYGLLDIALARRVRAREHLEDLLAPLRVPEHDERPLDPLIDSLDDADDERVRAVASLPRPECGHPVLVVALPPCPAWCQQPMSHPWEDYFWTDDEEEDRFFRWHDLALLTTKYDGVSVYVNQVETVALDRVTDRRLEAPDVSLQDRQGHLSGGDARLLAAALTRATELVELIDAGHLDAETAGAAAAGAWR